MTTKDPLSDQEPVWVPYQPFPGYALVRHRKLLVALRWKIDRDLDRLHDELLAKLRTMARSVGQRTRADRL